MLDAILEKFIVDDFCYVYSKCEMFEDNSIFKIIKDRYLRFAGNKMKHISLMKFQNSLNFSFCTYLQFTITVDNEFDINI